MKKILVLGLLSSFFSVGAFAAACPDTSGTATAVAAPTSSTTATGEMCACAGAAGKTDINGGSGAVVTTPVFIKNGFIAQCSANTMVSFNEVAATAFAVAGGSRKGNQTVIGSSNGGSVTTDLACATTGCTAANVTAANGRATTASSSN
jgi:hypothetical protein